MAFNDQIERRQWLLTQLNAGVKLTTHMLAQRFEVVKSTAQRDFEHYRNQGIIKLDKKTHIWQLMDKARLLPDLYIAQKEWVALLISEQILSTQSTDLSRNLLKLVQRYRPNMGSLASPEQIRSSVSACLTDFEEIDENIFQTCLTAVFQREVLSFKYYKPINNNHSDRLISPQHLVLHDGKWMLISWDHIHQKLKNFLPSRIQSFQVVRDTPFHYVNEEEVQLHLKSSYGVFKGKAKGTAVLQFSKKMSYIAERRVWHKNERKEWQNGQLTIHLPYSHEAGILQEILSFGSDVEVLSPLELRRQLIEKLEETIKKYKK